MEVTYGEVAFQYPFHYPRFWEKHIIKPYQDGLIIKPSNQTE
jgi:hypothetical protein